MIEPLFKLGMNICLFGIGLLTITLSLVIIVGLVLEIYRGVKDRRTK